MSAQLTQPQRELINVIKKGITVVRWVGPQDMGRGYAYRRDNGRTVTSTVQALRARGLVEVNVVLEVALTEKGQAA